MINQVTIVGRLVKTPDLFITENGTKGSFVTLAVGRPFKNADGEYETDFLDCTLWTGIAENTAEYCQKGDVIGVRGRLQSRLIENEDGTKTKKMDIIAERVTFLASAKNNNDGVISIEDTNEEEKPDNSEKKKNQDKNKK